MPPRSHRASHSPKIFQHSSTVLEVTVTAVTRGLLNAGCSWHNRMLGKFSSESVGFPKDRQTEGGENRERDTEMQKKQKNRPQATNMTVRSLRTSLQHASSESTTTFQFAVPQFAADPYPLRYLALHLLLRHPPHTTHAHRRPPAARL